MEGEALMFYALYEDENRNLAEGLSRVDSALQVFEALDSKDWMMKCLSLKGSMEHRRGAYPAGIATFERLQKLARGNDGDLLRAHCMEEIATMRYKMGQLEDGEQQANKALAIFEKANSNEGIADCLKLLGNLAGEQNMTDESIRYYVRAAERYKEANDIHGQANCLYNIGIAWRVLKDYDKSILSLQEAVGCFTQSSSVGGVGIANMEMGNTYLMMGEISKSESALLLAESLLKRCGDVARLAQLEEYLAKLKIRQGKRTDATAYYRMAIGHYDSMKLTNDTARVRETLRKHEETGGANGPENLGSS
jgi:tetratricopeptide (TPR) repeat protein